MAFIDTRFPDDISFGASGGPGFSTTIVATDGGSEYRNRNWALERSEYEVSHAARLPAQVQALLSFFRIAAGRANTWRFKDWVDYQATASEGILVAAGEKTFQMYKRYSTASTNYDRKITKPVSGTVTVTGGTGVSINYATGIVTVTSGTPTAWAGQFDVHCRFDIDRMRHTTVGKSTAGSVVVGWDSIPIVEVRD